MVALVGCTEQSAMGPAASGEGAGPSAPAGAGGPPAGTGNAPSSVVGGTGGQAAVNPGCGQITYPATGFYGPNVLDPAVTSFRSNPASYELAADLPPGASITLKLTLVKGSGTGVPWAHALDGDWRVGDFDAARGEQVFVSRSSGRIETRIFFLQRGEARIDLFECGAAAPTRTKNIQWTDVLDGVGPGVTVDCEPDIPGKIFKPECGACHGSNAPDADLDLLSPGVKTRLIGIPSKTCPGKLLVTVDPVPDGVFFQTLVAPRAAGCTNPLHAGGTFVPLAPIEVKCLRDWIKPTP
jgi:hypothetical protein